MRAAIIRNAGNSGGFSAAGTQFTCLTCTKVQTLTLLLLLLQFQNCHMGIRAPKSIAAAGLDSQVLYDAKVATFRFLYDQIQHGSGIMRTLDSTTLQPMDIIKLMDIRYSVYLLYWYKSTCVASIKGTDTDT